MKHANFRFYLTILLICTVWFCLFAEQAAAIGDGPRAYQLLPDKTDVLLAYGIFTDGNQGAQAGQVFQGADIDVDLAAVQYIHTFSIKGQQAAFFTFLPFGELEGSVRLLNRTISGKSAGIGDLMVGCVFGIIGSPALPAKELAASPPGFTFGVLGKVTLPTGEYDESKVLNLGSNRYSMQVGLPTTYSFGKSLFDPELLRFELLPSITVYSDNNDPYNADECEQDPLFNIEAHVIRNLGKIFWISVDALYSFGGETTTDEICDDNRQASFSIGGTLNGTLTKNLSAKLSYGKTVYHNDNGMDGHMVRAILNYAF